MTEHVVISSSIQKSVNEIDRLVQEIGLESPEIGNKALHEAVQQRVTNSVVVTKQRIKKSKALLPYRCISTETRHPQHYFVVQKIEERPTI